MKLEELGYGEPYRSAFARDQVADEIPARVASVSREHCVLWAEAGVLHATVSGRVRRDAEVGQWPVVGDWVAARLDAFGPRAHVSRVLPRKSLLARKRVERSSALQPMAANVDFVFLVSALNRDFSPRRLERALALIWESGAQPVVLLTKLDLCLDPTPYLEEAQAVALGVPVHAVSVVAGLGLEVLSGYLQPARTVALIGSSGVGKSTLVNYALNEARAEVAEARASDDKGRHTTTARELFLLPSGALWIDTPGMRELGVTEANAGLSTTFADIDGLAARCRFGDCGHGSEPGCAIRAALASAELDAARFAAYRQLQRELAHERRRVDERARHEHRREVRRIQSQRTRALRAHRKP